MFENLSYKKKFYILIILAVLLGITAYQRSLTVTFETIKLFEQSEKKLEVIKNSEERIFSLKDEIEGIDNIIGKGSTNPDKVQQEILNQFPRKIVNAELVRLEEVHKSNDTYFNVYSNRLIISGSFNDLLKTTYYYEKSFDYSRIISAKFYLEKHPRTKRKILYQQIIFQNYEKI